MVTAGPRTRRRDEEERIILMKSRDRRALDFIRIILSFSSSPDFSTKNVRIYDRYVSIWCHGGDHSKWSNFVKTNTSKPWPSPKKIGPRLANSVRSEVLAAYLRCRCLVGGAEPNARGPSVDGDNVDFNGNKRWWHVLVSWGLRYTVYSCDSRFQNDKND